MIVACELAVGRRGCGELALLVSECFMREDCRGIFIVGFCGSGWENPDDNRKNEDQLDSCSAESALENLHGSDVDLS